MLLANPSIAQERMSKSGDRKSIQLLPGFRGITEEGVISCGPVELTARLLLQYSHGTRTLRTHTMCKMRYVCDSTASEVHGQYSRSRLVGQCAFWPVPTLLYSAAESPCPKPLYVVSSVLR